jgi:outer membrane protein
MSSNKKIATAVAVLVATFAGAAAAQTGNDLLSIYRDALANDPQYSSAKFAQQAAVERTPQARAGLLPNVTGSVGYNVNNREIDPPKVSDSFNTWGPALQLTMPLYRAQNWDAVSQARLAVTQSEAQLAQSRQDLILRVTQAYFDVLAAEDALTAINANKQAVSEQLAQAKREFQVGTKTIVDTTEAQARYDQIVAQEQTARGDLVIRRNALRAIIGRDPGTLLPLRERPELTPPQPADIDEWAKRAEQASYPVVSAELAADIARIETQRRRHGHWPTLDFSASVSQTKSNGSTTFSVPKSSTASAAGVQLTIPIYSGGLTQSLVREALANEERSKQDLEFARRTAAQGARQAYTGVDFGLAQVRALESAEVSAKSQLDSTRLGYQVGVRINLDVLNANTQLFSTQRDLKKARYDFLVNGLRLKAAAGALDDEDVTAINGLLAR